MIAPAKETTSGTLLRAAVYFTLATSPQKCMSSGREWSCSAGEDGGWVSGISNLRNLLFLAGISVHQSPPDIVEYPLSLSGTIARHQNPMLFRSIEFAM